MSVCVSVYLSIYPSIYPTVRQAIYLWESSPEVSGPLSAFGLIFILPSIHLSIRLSIYLSSALAIYLCVSEQRSVVVSWLRR